MKLQINRFPIFSALCYAIAKRLGYSEDEARSLAVTRAKLGAAAKAGSLGAGKKQSVYQPAEGAKDNEVQADIEQILFVGMKPYVARVQTKVYGLMHSSGKAVIIRPDEFESSTIRKINAVEAGACDKILDLFTRLAACYPLEELNLNGYKLWEKIAPMVVEKGVERKPKLGEKAVFDSSKVEQLIQESGRSP